MFLSVTRGIPVFNSSYIVYNIRFFKLRPPFIKLINLNLFKIRNNYRIIGTHFNVIHMYRYLINVFFLNFMEYKLKMKNLCLLCLRIKTLSPLSFCRFVKCNKVCFWSLIHDLVQAKLTPGRNRPKVVIDI